MKRPRCFLILLTVLLLATVPVCGQVGINTLTPRKTLEVAGDMKASNNFEIENTKDLADSQSSNFLLQESGNKIKSIDVSNPSGAALGYIQVYEIVHPDKDWVLDFDTGVDATDFVLVTISAVFNRDLGVEASNNEEDYFSLPYTAAFISGGTWHMIADYPNVANDTTPTEGIWTITTLIFSRDLSKQLGVINIPMAGGTTGNAVSPIID